MVSVLKHPVAVALLVASAWPIAVRADAPVVTHSIPAALRAGSTLDVTFYGERLTSPTGIWTSFPAKAELASPSDPKTAAKSATYRVTVPEAQPPGIGAVRVATKDGASDLLLIAIDDLASTVEAAENHNLAKAQAIPFPIAVDGACQAEQSDYFKFTASAGQRISIEVLARRLGSPLDPVLRLLDERGNELAYADDDPAAGADCRMLYSVPVAGNYVLELRDIRFLGGDKFRYRLRIGEFPLATAPYPLAVQRGVLTSVGLVGRAVEGTTSTTVAPPLALESATMRLRAAFSGGSGSSWVTLMAADAHDQLEQEPNDAPQSSTACTLPGAVEGRLDRAGDRDYFHFEARKGQRLIFEGQTRSIGSPADLFLRLYKADGSMISEVDDSASDEGRLDYRFPADGIYRLRVEDVNAQSGPDYVYRIQVTPYRAGFALTADAQKYSAPEGGVFVAKVNVARRDYAGPIKLSVEGAGDGLSLAGDEVPRDKSEATLRVTLPPRMAAGTLTSMSIIGGAQIDGAPVREKASTLGLLRGALGGLPYPPVELVGALGLAVTPKFPKFFELAVAAPTHILPQPGQATTVTVQAKRLADFADRIDLVVSDLPAGVTAKPASIEKGHTEVGIELVSARQLPGVPYHFRIVGSAVFKEQPQQVVLDKLQFQPKAPLQLAFEPRGSLRTGGKMSARLRFVGEVGEGMLTGKFEPGVTLAGDGPRAPSQPGFEPDNRAAVFSGLTKADGAMRAVVPELSSGDYTLECWVFHPGSAQRANRPIAGYFFSRAAPGALRRGAGDHLGIGGTLPGTPQDRLFVFNGETIVAGKTALAVDAWHHVVWTRSGDAILVYLDGNVAAPEIRGTLGLKANPGHLVFGARSDGRLPFEGRLDELAVYNGSLAPDHIAAHYAAATRPESYAAKVLEDNPIAYWRLNETEGRVARDVVSSGRGRVVELAWKNLPAGISAPRQVKLASGEIAAEVELTSSAEAAAGKFNGVSVAATIKVDGRPLTVESPPAVVEIATP